MLEKIGLPAKPSAKGSAWVVDASHCQGCSSQFTFFNRKHHCRRCGGIFCGNCTQSRMCLRGQGDAPVRICEPCKTIEEAIRFERRNKQTRGTVVENADSLLNSLLNSPSSSSEKASAESSPTSPEILRQHAQDEMAKYRILKTEGKPGEAREAFKRSKELERQADALALSIRKNSRLAAKASKTSSGPRVTEKKGPTLRPVKQASEPDDVMKDLKDLGWKEDEADEDAAILGEVAVKPRATAAIASLDADILAHKRKALAFKRQGNLTEAKEELKKAKILEKRKEELEILGGDEDEEGDDGDELSAIIRNLEKEASSMGGDYLGDYLPDEDIPVPGDDDVGEDVVTENDLMDPEMMAALKNMGWEEEAESTSDSPSVEELQEQIKGHKRKALALKQENKIVEAKNELKQAKSLEQILESRKAAENDEVTDHDMQDPTLLSALKAMGFDDGDGPGSRVTQVSVKPQQGLNELFPPKPGPSRRQLPKRSKLEIQRDLLGIKRKARDLRREGKTDEADKELEAVKDLEMQLKALEGCPVLPEPKAEPEAEPEEDIEENDEVTVEDMLDPTLLSALSALGFQETPAPPVEQVPEKLLVAEDVLFPATPPVEERVPEKLEDIFSHVETVSSSANAVEQKHAAVDLLTGDDWTFAAQAPQAQNFQVSQGPSNSQPRVSSTVQVTSSISQPRISSVHSTQVPSQPRISPVPSTEVPPTVQVHSGEPSKVISQDKHVVTKKHQVTTVKQMHSAAEISSSSTSLAAEILAHKRRAVAFKRANNLEAAKEELLRAKALEKIQMQPEIRHEPPPEVKQEVRPEVKPEVRRERKKVEQRDATKDRLKLQREALAHKRKAMGLRREGKVDEAEAETEKARQLEKQLEELEQPAVERDAVEDVFDPQLLAALQGVGLK